MKSTGARTLGQIAKLSANFGSQQHAFHSCQARFGLSFLIVLFLLCRVVPDDDDDDDDDDPKPKNGPETLPEQMNVDEDRDDDDDEKMKVDDDPKAPFGVFLT